MISRINIPVLFIRFALATIICVTAGCADAEPGPGRGNVDRVLVRFGAAVPGTAVTRSLYDNEYLLSEADLLVFHEGRFYEHVTGSTPVTTGSGYTFEAALTYSDEPVTIFVVGNCNTALAGHPALVRGAAIQEVIEGLEMSFVGYASGLTDLFPLSGEVSLRSLTEETVIERLRLLRAFARIEVEVANNAQDHFTLVSVQAFRAPERFRILTDRMDGAGTKVTGPCVPELFAYSENTYAATGTDGKTITGIYLPESEAGEIDDVSCVVVGGRFNNGPVSYYRLDLIKDGVTGRLLRNHNYTITITSISGDGHTSATDAATNPSQGINTDLIDWQDDGTNTIYDKDGKYISLTSRDIPLHFYENSIRSVTVDKTIANDYTVEFADQDGKPVGGQVCRYGQQIDNGVFRVRVAADGSTITAIAITENDSAGDTKRIQKLLVSIGNIEFTVTITQSSRFARDHIHIFNLVGLEGDLGDEVMNVISSNPVGDRRWLLDILKKEENFGYYGRVPFAGYKVSGLNYQIAISKHLIEIFDVIFVGFANTVVVDANEARNLRSWVGNNNKVLVVYCNNNVLMAELGVTASAASNHNASKGYYLSADTPGFILEGPFGTVDPAYVTAPVAVHSTVHTIDPAAYPDIKPVLMNPVDDRILIGVDTGRRIVYYNDYMLYDKGNTLLTGNGTIGNDLDRVIANLWAWIAETVLGDRRDTDN